MTDLQTKIMSVLGYEPYTSAHIAELVNQKYSTQFTARAVSNALTFLRGECLVDDGAKCIVWKASMTGEAQKIVFQRDDLWTQNPRHWAKTNPATAILKIQDDYPW